jgi:hypothetical protein
MPALWRHAKVNVFGGSCNPFVGGHVLMSSGKIEENEEKNGAGDGNRKQLHVSLAPVSGLPPDFCRISVYRLHLRVFTPSSCVR